MKKYIVIILFFFTCISYSQRLSSIYFLNEMIGWVGDNTGELRPKIYKTCDGSKSWEIMYDGALGGLTFVNDTVGFFSTYRKAFKTTNKGLSWTEVYSDSDRSFYYRSKFFDEHNGYIIRRVPEPITFGGINLIKTSDGGATWENIASFEDVRGYYIHDMDNIICFLPEKRVLRTSNGGQDWIESQTLYDSYYGVYFVDQKKGFITESNYESIQVTYDGGATWELDTLGFYGSMKITDTLNFYLNLSYRLFKSTNGGNSWFKLNHPSDSVMNYFFLNKDIGYAIGRSYYFAKTTDGGYTWIQYPFNLNNPTYLYEPNKYLQFSLEQNFPNPFNPSTKIKYSLSKQGLVTIKVYDILGKETAQLVNEEKSSGEYEVEFDGRSLSSGIYYYKIQAGEFMQTKKMVLMK